VKSRKTISITGSGWSQWPRGLRRGFAAVRLLGLWFRFPLGACLSVSCDCFVLSGRGLCDELVPRPEEPYRMCGVSECDREASIMRRPWPTRDCCAMEKWLEGMETFIGKKKVFKLTSRPHSAITCYSPGRGVLNHDYGEDFTLAQTNYHRQWKHYHDIGMVIWNISLSPPDSFSTVTPTNRQITLHGNGCEFRALTTNITSFRRKVLNTFSFHAVNSKSTNTVPLHVEVINGNMGLVTTSTILK
jgi:hypothetical protein